jgi:FkbM family methyltransferase
MKIPRFLKKLAYQGLSAYGLRLYSDHSLPHGIDLKHDITHLGGQKIECVFDVGANVGQSVLRFGAYWPNAKIFSFEPVKSTFHQLVDNTHDFLNVRCENIALGASRGTEKIWLKERSASNSLKTDVNRQETGIGIAEEIEIITLDEYCKENRVDNIDFLKIDAEGYELEVLEGANRMLTSRAIRFIYAESTFNLSDSQHTPITKLTDYLTPLSYRCWDIYDKMRRPDAYGHTYIRWCDALFIQQD